MRPVLLVDGNHLARRSYFTVGRSLRTDKGKASGVVYGTINSLRKIAMKFNPCRMVVFFDGGHEAATKVYAAYKNNPTRNRDHEFYDQCLVVEELVEGMGLVKVKVDGVEADTLIGVASRELLPAYAKVLIVSSDHDMYQLLSSRVEIYDDLKSKAVTLADLSACYIGCGPRDMIGLKVLMGDRSDNIPGLLGMGETTALEVLRQLGGYGGVRLLARRGCSMPDPSDFPSRMQFRITKAFADPVAVRAIVKRNLRLVKIPTRADKLPTAVKREYLAQIGRQPSVRIGVVTRVLKTYQINSILGRAEEWIKPLVVAGGI